MTKIRPSQIQQAGAGDGNALVWDGPLSEWRPSSVVGPTGPEGPQGPQGRTPQFWFGDGPPGAVVGAQVGDIYIDRQSGDLYHLQ